jgi:hypothetical protein
MNCLNCRKILMGRKDKKYCDHHCKSAYQYAAKKGQQSPFFIKVDKQLRLNRKILKKYNVGGKAIVRHDILIKEGFNPSFFTHYWKNLEGNVYLFVYEYGFLKTTEHHRTKYVLIQWQDYMNKSV